jgi:hypothetical protein
MLLFALAFAIVCLFDRAAAALPPVITRDHAPSHAPSHTIVGTATSTLASPFQGYDEELYCPPGHCLRPRVREPGFAGPRTAFNECVGFKEGSPDVTAGIPPWRIRGRAACCIVGQIQTPAAWGEKLGTEARLKLINDGMQQARDM